MSKVSNNKSRVAVQIICRKIFMIREKMVILDRDLAELYGVEAKQLNRAVKLKIKQFPEDFMFQATLEELNSSRYQFDTLKSEGNIKYLPYVFTEQGISMLPSVFNGDRDIEVNIQIMRAFIAIREIMIWNLVQRIEGLERKYRNHQDKFRNVFDVIRQLRTSRSVVASDAREGVIKKHQIIALEKKHRAGYLKRPVRKGEFGI